MLHRGLRGLMKPRHHFLVFEVHEDHDASHPRSHNEGVGLMVRPWTGEMTMDIWKGFRVENRPLTR